MLTNIASNHRLRGSRRLLYSPVSGKLISPKLRFNLFVDTKPMYFPRKASNSALNLLIISFSVSNIFINSSLDDDEILYHVDTVLSDKQDDAYSVDFHISMFSNTTKNQLSSRRVVMSLLI